VELSPSSSLFTQIKTDSGINVEKHHGRFVYFSGSAESYDIQKKNRAMPPVSVQWPTDADAVEILVQFIKHPGVDIQQLADKVKSKGRQMDSAIIREFLVHHDLLKKTSD